MKVNLQKYLNTLDNKFEKFKLPGSTVRVEDLKYKDLELTVDSAMYQIATDLTGISERELFKNSYDWYKLGYLNNITDKNLITTLKHTLKVINKDTISRYYKTMIHYYILNVLIMNYVIEIDIDIWANLMLYLDSITWDYKLEDIRNETWKICKLI